MEILNADSVPRCPDYLKFVHLFYFGILIKQMTTIDNDVESLDAGRTVATASTATADRTARRRTSVAVRRAVTEVHACRWTEAAIGAGATSSSRVRTVARRRRATTTASDATTTASAGGGRLRRRPPAKRGNSTYQARSSLLPPSPPPMSCRRASSTATASRDTPDLVARTSTRVPAETRVSMVERVR